MEHARNVTREVMQRGIEVDRSADIRLAVHEALVNALVHGHLGDHTIPITVTVSGACNPEHPGDAKERSEQRRVDRQSPDQRRSEPPSQGCEADQNAVHVEIADQALGGSWTVAEDRPDAAEGVALGGRGLRLMEACADRMQYESDDTGTRVSQWFDCR